MIIYTILWRENADLKAVHGTTNWGFGGTYINLE